MQMNRKMLLMLGASVLTGAGIAAEAKVEAKPEAAKAQAAVAAMNAPKGLTVEEAFAFLPEKIAEIAGKPVTKAEFIANLKATLPDGKLPDGIQSAMLKMFAPQMIEQFIQKQLLVKAAADAKVTVTAAEIVAKFKADVAKMPEEQRKMLTEVLKQQGKTIDEVINAQAADPRVQETLLLDKFLSDKFKDAQTVTEAEAQKFYDANKQRFAEPGDEEGTVRAAHILIKAGDKPEEQAAAKAKIEAIAKQVKAGEDFGKLAEAVSECPSGKSSKGSLGAFGPGAMVPEFEKAAFALKVGEVSAPVQTKFGYHLIKREAAQAAKQLPFSAVKDEIMGMLKQQNVGNAVKAFIDDLMKANKVQILVKAPEMPAAALAAPAQAPAAK